MALKSLCSLGYVATGVGRLGMKMCASKFGLVALAALAALAVFPTAASAAACALTAADFESLKLSKAALATQAEVDAYPADRQSDLCRTRAAWKRITSGNWVDDDLANVMRLYLSPTEAVQFQKLQNAAAIAKIKGMSDDEWKQFRQNLIDGLKK